MIAPHYAFGPFQFDMTSGCLLRESRPVAVSVRGLSILAALVAAGGQTVTKAALMDAAWPGLAVEESNLTVQIAALRKLMGRASDGTEWIVTVPRMGYRFSGALQKPLSSPKDCERTEARARPAIAVLPFENLSGDLTKQYLVDGITDDVIMALARYRWLRVASRGSSFAWRSAARESKYTAVELGVDFLVDGVVRHAVGRTRITAHLTNAADGRTIWSEHYDIDEAEMFAVQDAIAERIAGAVEPELLLQNGLEVTPHTGNATAWDVVRQGTFNFHKLTRPTHLLARQLFREAAELDPMLGEAQLWRARVSAGLIAYGWSEDPDESGREGLDSALRAIYLDNRNPYAHYALAIVSAYTGRLEQAILAAERSIELSPSFALGHLVLGMARLFKGDAIGATGPIVHGLRINPHDPQNAVWFTLLMLARFFSGDVCGALETGREAVKARPGWPSLLRTLACCHAALGDWPEARRLMRTTADLPNTSADALGPLRERNPNWAATLERLLQEAAT